MPPSPPRSGRTRRRAGYAPTVGLEAEVDRILTRRPASWDRWATSSPLVDTSWNVGVPATLPLVTGGRARPNAIRSREELERLRLDRRSAEDKLRQRILSALDRAAASWPTISLRRESARSRPATASWRHPVGGTVLCYYDLARALGADQPVYGHQARGLVEGEEPRRRIEEMAAEYLRSIRGVRPEGPYALLGWSLGGMVAYEMARQQLEEARSSLRPASSRRSRSSTSAASP